jgi:CHAT domain-containing protein
VRAVSRRAESAARDTQDADALRAQGLIDLLDGRPTEKTLTRAISSLRTAAELAGRPAPVLSDLAAAHLARGELAGTPRDVMAALEAAEQALEMEPRNADALFNRALAMQRWGLVEEAADAWRGWLAVAPRSASAPFARRSLQALAGISGPPAAPAADADLAAYGAYAAADPQGARVLGWCRLLGEWGEAVLAGDPARAEARLARAEALGVALERRRGGDASLADEVRAIRAARGEAVRRLATGHHAYAEGCRHDDQTEFAAAAAQYGAAADAARRDSPALFAWARLMYGGAVFHGGRPRQGEAVLRGILSATDLVRTPALAGQAHQLLAMIMLRGDRYEGMLEEARRSEPSFAAAGERENVGVALDAQSNALFAMGDPDEGYRLSWRALQILRVYRDSRRLHNLLGFQAHMLMVDGLQQAGLRISAEGVRVAGHTGVPSFEAEAWLADAQMRAARGDRVQAVRELAAARRLASRIGDAWGQGWMAARRQMGEAATLLETEPGRAVAALDSAAAFFLSNHAPLLALSPVVDAARARLAQGDTAGAAKGLRAALSILELRRDSIRMEPRRAATFEAAREVVDRVAMLRLAGGDTAGALAVLDRGRATLATTGPDARSGGAMSAPPGEVAVEYALVADTLLTWTVRGTRVELYRTVLDTTWLARTAEHLLLRLESGADEAELRPTLAELYDRLVRPVEARLGVAETPLVVVADGDVASIPFAALYDARRHRYLVQDRPIRFAVSLRAALRRTPARMGGAGAVFVADPAFVASREPGFPRLPAAAREAVEIAATYPGAQVLRDREATRVAVLDALRGAPMFHYAGHAVFDDERPEQSYLLLARGGPLDVGRLHAGEIAQLDLRGVALVVLSACRTVRTGGGRAEGFSGLSGAFLAAGAGGTVGSLWEVDDRLTQPLMMEFHRAWRATGNGPAALRAAQLRMLASPDRRERSPAAWAGFRYAGQ